MEAALRPWQQSTWCCRLQLVAEAVTRRQAHLAILLGLLVSKFLRLLGGFGVLHLLGNALLAPELDGEADELTVLLDEARQGGLLQQVLRVLLQMQRYPTPPPHNQNIWDDVYLVCGLIAHVNCATVPCNPTNAAQMLPCYCAFPWLSIPRQLCFQARRAGL